MTSLVYLRGCSFLFTIFRTPIPGFWILECSLAGTAQLKQTVVDLPVGVSSEDVLDHDDAFLYHIVDFVADQLQQDIDASFCSALKGDSALSYGSDSLHFHFFVEAFRSSFGAWSKEDTIDTRICSGQGSSKLPKTEYACLCQPVLALPYQQGLKTSHTDGSPHDLHVDMPERCSGDGAVDAEACKSADDAFNARGPSGRPLTA